MANVIQHKRSATPGAVPAANQLAEGELAVNVADGILFVKNTEDEIVKFPNLPTTADENNVLAWDGSKWIAVTSLSLLSVIDGGNASET